MTDATTLPERRSGPADRSGPDGDEIGGGDGPGRPSRRFRPSVGLWDATPPSVLLAEASELAEARRWRKAVQLLTIAVTTAVDPSARRAALRRLAEVAADSGRHGLCSDAVYELKLDGELDAETWATFANVALARGNHLHADRAARNALELDQHHHRAWVALAASFAGLGWFEEAAACLDHIGRETLTDQDRRRIGRAVNRWAMAKSRWWVVAVPAAVLVGILSVAIAVSIPVLTRDRRLGPMRTGGSTRPFEAMAVEAWRSERRLRALNGLAVIGSVLAFVLATIAG